jgi:hypothetical protein
MHHQAAWLQGAQCTMQRVTQLVHLWPLKLVTTASPLLSCYNTYIMERSRCHAMPCQWAV